MSELIIAKDENGNTFQVTPEEAKAQGLTPVGPAPKTPAKSGAKPEAKAVEKSDAAVEDEAVGGPPAAATGR